MQVFCNVCIWHPAVFKCLEVRLLETLLALALFEHWGCIVVCSTPNFLLVPVDNKRHNLQQNDITRHYGPSISSPFSPTPTFRVSRWTAGQPIGQPFSLWEHNFITEMNCLIVRTQLPPLAEVGGAMLDTGASCGDLASGVISLTVWKASHVTHHWMTAAPSQPTALTQPHQAPVC